MAGRQPKLAVGARRGVFRPVQAPAGDIPVNIPRGTQIVHLGDSRRPGIGGTAKFIVTIGRKRDVALNIGDMTGKSGAGEHDIEDVVDILFHKIIHGAVPRHEPRFAQGEISRKKIGNNRAHGGIAGGNQCNDIAGIQPPPPALPIIHHHIALYLGLVRGESLLNSLHRRRRQLIGAIICSAQGIRPHQHRRKHGELIVIHDAVAVMILLGKENDLRQGNAIGRGHGFHGFIHVPQNPVKVNIRARAAGRNSHREHQTNQTNTSQHVTRIHEVSPLFSPLLAHSTRS